MTPITNVAVDFADEALEGFASAHAKWVTAVPGGVIRTSQPRDATVAVVTGGGTGHYPAPLGMVGPGLAHGAAVGNVFSSPSSAQIEAVARAVDRGEGVLFCFWNYAGDVMHFGRAQRNLQDSGIDCRMVVISDDVLSRPWEAAGERRGIAGSLAILKCVGAAADAGLSLDEVERIGRLANGRTKTAGVAFGGCTLPGAKAPLFEVADGKMAVGMGIHGEPGIDLVDMPTADELAELLVSGLIDESSRAGITESGVVIPILNGLGSTKHDELFVIYRRVQELLRREGHEVADPQVGEFCTSFSMAGVSLSLFWPDQELRSHWAAWAAGPAGTFGGSPGGDYASVNPASVAPAVGSQRQRSGAEDFAGGSRDPRAVAAAHAFEVIRSTLEDHSDELGELDAIAGDGDHGMGMLRGAAAAEQASRHAAESGESASSVLIAAGDAWSDKGGGTSGAVWGVLLGAIGRALSDGDLTPHRFAAAVNAASAAVREFGGAQVGDKTMVDALVPFAAALDEQVSAGRSFEESWVTASDMATAAALSTAALSPKRGRATTHGDRAKGSPDPGAISFAHIVRSIAPLLSD